MKFLIYMVTFVIVYHLAYFILKTIEYFYGTQVAIVVGLLSVGIALIAVWRLIIDL